MRWVRKRHVQMGELPGVEGGGQEYCTWQEYRQVITVGSSTIDYLQDKGEMDNFNFI